MGNLEYLRFLDKLVIIFKSTVTLGQAYLLASITAMLIASWQLFQICPVVF